ncbi:MULTISPECIES: putative 2-aminoethylphosphonate ABC transporter ATP-binding protein [unclassified Pseudomonas]|jgi:iron(III) transport system ATP-binding protein|uniref:putative 2-aminoethylphosphonate ABC transporter ATP-binding protein n=1 Tax=unclassified Pseudomonas TaxID=196821 RepID=UPI000C85D8CC|nr:MULTISPECIES: putative 2-aminoethylphosphonate ABC transporter ATP-binding protein [unclassified Pseudomonas]MDX9671612.1 putative 2-aminoethylphosphonate ABC transporter ATP-binding protein [Pseudomonas sp. P8_250]PMQ13201.1 Sulfate/thiosulfate import ATP-binding protein CysA [Pseudomonas sp. AD21]WPN34412.1 putative 2-aminoethylphosphonate ABC transporter ATP-binding protein [Pseudomonas sp. P8_139]WPN43789.1 putative 2-aminoethylphosphonate ABC transporter ATP-binding protein [Pseudomonas
MNPAIATALTNPGAPMKVRGVQKRFGAFTALDNVSLDVAAGELVCLLGPSGCGKTTLLRCIAGLEKQDSGELYLGERDVSHLAPQARDYGILFQSYALFPNLTVEANIAYGLAGSGRDEVRRRVAQMLELVGLTGSEKKYPGQLSGGQQQRVALARALAPAPSLLLLDEPMSALDARVREHLCTELRQLQRNLGITTLMVTHNQDEAMLMADRIAVMNNGRVEQYATPQEIYNRPATPFVAEFVGQGNWLPFQRSSDSHAQVGGMNLRLADGSVHSASGRLFCRPEAINVNPLVHEENLFPAKVREITFLGNRCRMSFELDQLPGHSLLAELAPEAMPRLGAQQIMVALPPRSLQVFA